MKKLRFIHTGDIHLGSFLHIRGESLPPTIEDTIQKATLEGFKRICHRAIMEDVDFVAISGDLYDREARSVRAMSFFVEQCQALKEANIPLLIIAGNHDPLRERQDLFEMPDNVRVFSGDRPETFEVLDTHKNPIARVIGQSYRGRSEPRRTYLDYKVPEDGLWNIGLLHTQLDPGNSNYIPCSLGDLREMTQIHYWALGHIHQQRVLNHSHPLIAYSGIPQGRDFGEQGRGGCMLVELNPLQGRNVTFIPMAPVIYQRIEVPIDRDPENMPETLEDLEDIICRYGDGLLKVGREEGDYPIDGYVVEWIIRGRGIIHDSIMEQEQESLELLTENLRRRFGMGNPFLWTESISLRTQPPMDYDTLMKNSTVFGELERVIQKCLEDEKMKARLIGELGEIWSHDGDYENRDSSHDFCFHMDEATLEEILNSAKGAILEKLVEGRNLG